MHTRCSWGGLNTLEVSLIRKVSLTRKLFLVSLGLINDNDNSLNNDNLSLMRKLFLVSFLSLMRTRKVS